MRRYCRTCRATDKPAIAVRIRRGHLRVRTLVTLRWLVLGGEAVLLLVAGLLLDFKAPYGLCFAVIGADGKMVDFIQGVSTQGWEERLATAVQTAVDAK